MMQVRKMCGGTGDEQQAEADVQALVESVKEAVVSELGTPPQELRATHFKTQVVAGTNYFVRVHIGAGKHVHLRIYKHFSGTVSLHGVRHHEAGGVSEAEPLDYFEQNVN